MPKKALLRSRIATTLHLIAICAKMGVVCVSFSVEHNDTQGHHFTMDEFWERFNRAFQ